MANHLRRQIREGVAAAVTGLATTGSRVFSSRVYSLSDSDLPALSIFCEAENSEVYTVHPQRVLRRTVSVIVEGSAKGTAGVDNTLDQIAKEVEIALVDMPAPLVGIAKAINLTGTNIDLVGTSEKPTGQIRLVYAVEYFAAENAPDVAL